jgi:hypothetical protein
MPNYSTTTTKISTEVLGMGLVHFEKVKTTEDHSAHAASSSSTTRHKIKDVHDTVFSCCGCDPSYDSDDVDADKEAELIQQYPRFKEQIECLIAKRRDRFHIQQQGKGACVIL